MVTHTSFASKKWLTAFCAVAIVFAVQTAWSRASAIEPPYDNLDSVALLDAIDQDSPTISVPSESYSPQLYALDSTDLVDAVNSLGDGPSASPSIGAPTLASPDISIYSLDGTDLLDAVDGE